MVGDPPYFSVDHFLYHFLKDCEKNEPKINVGRLKNSISFVHVASNFGIRAAVSRVEMWPLNDEISLENVSSSPNFLVRHT